MALGYANRTEALAESLIEQFDSLLADKRTSAPARVLATLISVGAMEIKLAVRADRKAIAPAMTAKAAGAGNRPSPRSS